MPEVQQDFHNLPQTLYTGSQVREMDRITIEDCGISGEVLMERAGNAAFNIITEIWPAARKIAVVCGGGNNGGDGYVISRLLHDGNKHSVSTLYTTMPGNLKGDAKQAADKLIKSGVQPEIFNPGKLHDADLIVDAMLGTGLDREVRDDLRDVIEHINNSTKPVLSIDIPSGLHADTGNLLGTGVIADATISFIGLKQGLFTGQGPACAGTVYFNDLQVPEDVYGKIQPSAHLVSMIDQARLLKKRDRSAHKGDFGHVLVIGGEVGYAGAVRMCAEAAARVGAGLVSIATHEQHAVAINMTRPEIMAHGIENDLQLSALIEKANVIAIGPGLGQSGWSKMLFSRALDCGLPLIVDADALNLLAVDPVKHSQWILTPHPGEAARLIECNSAEIQRDRFAAVTRIQNKYGGVIVLKGSGTLISDHTGHVSICAAGNPGMATGGMGDVLTGVIAGLVAQNYSLSDAARLGVTVHATAADDAAKEGERGLLAMDLMPWLRLHMNDH